MRRRGLLRGVMLALALATAFVATPRPDRASLDPGAARALVLWSEGAVPTEVARALPPSDLALPPPLRPDGAFDGPLEVRAGAPPADATATDAALAGFAAPGEGSPRIDATLAGGADGAPARRPRTGAADLLAALERRARSSREHWLAVLVERGAGPTGDDRLAVWRFGPQGDAGGRGAGSARPLALDPRWLRGRLDAEQLDGWLAAHVAGPAEGAVDRWPRWIARPPVLDAKLVANGAAAEPFEVGADPPGWRAEGRVARTVTPEGVAWFEAVDGWCLLRQRIPLAGLASGVAEGPVRGPASSPVTGTASAAGGFADAGALELRLVAAFAPSTRGTVLVVPESAGGPTAVLELSETGERRMSLPSGARTALVEVRLTGDARGGAEPPRITGISIRLERSLARSDR